MPFFLLLFAATYVVLAALAPGNFGGRLSHSDGLSFSVTVFSTVGFGDITTKSQAARLVLTGQMITDLVVLGLAIKVIIGAARTRKGRPLTPTVLLVRTPGEAARSGGPGCAGACCSSGVPALHRLGG